MIGSYKKWFLAAMLLISFNGIAYGDDEKVTGIIIKGNRRIESAAILTAVRVKIGEPLSMERVDGDIRAIFKLGYFQDVEVETEKSEKGVVLVYKVKERPVIQEVRITGNKEISTEKIREALDLKQGAIYSAKDMARGVKKVKKLYTDDGYYLTEVNATTEKRSDTEMLVHLSVTEDKKVLIEKIRFEGNVAFSEKKLKKVMETGERWFLSWLTGAGTYKEDLLRNDVALITDHYYNNGYINVKVGEPKVDLLPDKSGLVVTIGITEGDQFNTGAIDFKGELLVGKEELAKKVKLKTGEIFSRAVLRDDISTLTDFYGDGGFAFANVNPIIQPDPVKKILSITFDFEKGQKVYIDRINIQGNTKTRDKVVRREMKIAEGDVYGTTLLKQSKKRLMDTGYFEEAIISTPKGSARDKLNVNVDVKEKPTGSFSVGGGYSTLDGLVGQASVGQSNFLGLGLKANLGASVGTKSQTYNLGVTDPYFLDTKWTVGGDIYRTERTFHDFIRRVTGGDIKGGYPLSETLTTMVVYRFEAKKITSESQGMIDNITLGLMPAPVTNSTTSSVTFSLNRNTTDYHPDPTKGMINSISFEVAGLGGTNRFVRYVGNTMIFIPLKWGTVLTVRGEVGQIIGIGQDIPIDERFYLGGINTLRGYGGRTVSPYLQSTVNLPDVNGYRYLVENITYTGGTTESFINTDFVFPLIKEAKLKGVVFFDIGNAADGFGNTFSRPLASYGAGVRWVSPMGPLRIEYGIPLNPRYGIDKSGGKIEFTIGNIF